VRTDPSVIFEPRNCNRSFPSENDIEYEIAFANAEKPLRSDLCTRQHGLVESSPAEGADAELCIKTIRPNIDRPPYQRRDISHRAPVRAGNCLPKGVKQHSLGFAISHFDCLAPFLDQTCHLVELGHDPTLLINWWEGNHHLKEFGLLQSYSVGRSLARPPAKVDEAFSLGKPFEKAWVNEIPVEIETREITADQRAVQFGRYNPECTMSRVDTGDQKLTRHCLYLTGSRDLRSWNFGSKG
jgi:hypothetical protein